MPRLLHRSHGARVISKGHRRAGGPCGCVRPIVAWTCPCGRPCGNLCRRPRDADDLRSDLGILKSSLDDVVTLEESELEEGMSAARVHP